MAVEIKGFLKNTFIDWEGEIASILFLPGCNFRCPYCHSPHLVLNSTELREIPFDTVKEFLESSRGWIDGVVLSGGEPTLQQNLESLVRYLRGMGLKIKLDTNGSNPRVLRDLISRGLVNFVAMDLKAPLDERYARAAGLTLDMERIEESLELLMEGNAEYEFRTTVVPSLLSERDLQDMAMRIRGAKKWVLQEFQGGNCLDPRYNAIRGYSKRELATFSKGLGRFVGSCLVRSSTRFSRFRV